MTNGTIDNPTTTGPTEVELAAITIYSSTVYAGDWPMIVHFRTEEEQLRHAEGFEDRRDGCFVNSTGSWTLAEAIERYSDPRMKGYIADPRLLFPELFPDVIKDYEERAHHSTEAGTVTEDNGTRTATITLHHSTRNGIAQVQLRFSHIDPRYSCCLGSAYGFDDLEGKIANWMSRDEELNPADKAFVAKVAAEVDRIIAEYPASVS